DASGSYALVGLAADKYNVSFTYGVTTFATRHDIAAGTSGLDVEIPPTGSLEGTMVGFHGLASVALRAGEINAYVTEVDGSFASADLVRAPSRFPANGEVGDPADANVTFSADAVAHVTLTVNAVTRIDGLVTRWPSGEPVAGASCIWLSANPGVVHGR